MKFGDLHTASHLLATVPVALTNSRLLRVFIVLYVLIDSCLNKVRVLLRAVIAGLVLSLLYVIVKDSQDSTRRAIGLTAFALLLLPEAYSLLSAIFDVGHGLDTQSLHVLHQVGIWTVLTAILVMNAETMITCS